jgi:ABC-2 type transport system ATP-binding protein
MSYLQIEEVTKTYSGHVAIKDLSFDIPAGAIFGLLGPNGAGKTTLIRIINQITAADTGKIIFDGEKLNPSHISKIGYLPEERGLYKKMKVLEQITYFARLKDMEKNYARTTAIEWLKKFDIYDWRNKKVEELSKGMQQKVQFILTVIHNPSLIILDEPFSGFDPVNTQMIKNEIMDLRDKGATIIFSTHRMESVEEICDHVGMINLSKKVLEGKVRDVRESFRKNEYVVDYAGDLNGLEFQPHSITELPDEGIHRAVFRSIAANDRKKLINNLNQKVYIHNFSEKLPSIHEIFIHKVEEGTNG